MKYRIRFAKYGVMRYVGHLDLMRFFQKALKRAQVPLSYSKGFHPHPLISFAAPLSVGVTSGGEYMDIVTEEALDTEALRDSLDAQMVEGVSIVGASVLADTAKNAMAAVEAADYFVYFRDWKGASGTDNARAEDIPAVTADSASDGKEDTRDANAFSAADGKEDARDANAFSASDVKEDTRDANAFSASDFMEGIRVFYTDAAEILVTKQTKKSERQLDLKPLIYDFTVQTVQEVTEPAFSDSGSSDVTDEGSAMDGNPPEGLTGKQEDGYAVLRMVLADAGADYDMPVFYLKVKSGSSDNIKPELVMEHFLRSMGIASEECRLRIHRMDMYQRRDDGVLCSLGG